MHVSGFKLIKSNDSIESRTDLGNPEKSSSFSKLTTMHFVFVPNW